MNNNTLLAPIAASNPCGVDLSFSAEFDAIQEWRREDDPTLDQGEWVTPLKSADWDQVQRVCTELLQTRTKDLRLALWFTEAGTRLDGYAGLARGLSLCAALCETHWDGLHPAPDGADMESRIGNMAWLLSRLPSWVLDAPLFGSGELGQSLRRIQAQKSGAMSGTTSGEPSRVGTEWDRTRGSLMALGADAWQQVLRDIDDARGQLLAWQAVVDARLGAEGPSFAEARRSLEDAAHELRRFVHELGLLRDSTPVIATTPEQGCTAVAVRGTEGPIHTQAVPDVRVAGVESAVTSRAQALGQLRSVAAYFRAHEPHSPVAYLADKAAQWGEMPLHEWLRSVVADGTTLRQLEDTLGVPPAVS